MAICVVGRRTGFSILEGDYFMRAPLIVLIFVASLQAVAQNAPASSVFDTKTIITSHPQPTVSFAPQKKQSPEFSTASSLCWRAWQRRPPYSMWLQPRTVCLRMPIARKGTRYSERILQPRDSMGSASRYWAVNCLPAHGSGARIRTENCGWRRQLLQQRATGWLRC
jgi:hypothetical protein